MINLRKLPSPVLIAGGAATAYRDPTATFHDGVLHLFFTVTEIEANGQIYMYVGHTATTDLITWTAIRRLTPRDQTRNFSSPGCVVRYAADWVLCLQTYPRPNGAKYGSSASRLWTMRSRDLESWSDPELLRVKGPGIPDSEMGRMIDPFLVQDKYDPSRWWCLFKQNGVSAATSTDLTTWSFAGRAEAGENACVIVDGDEYVLFHSPDNGIGMKRSHDLKTWIDCGITTLGQSDWPWAAGRVTAGFVLDLRRQPGVGKYVMFFHGSGPEDETTMFDCYASIGIAWSDDLVYWEWPASLDSNTR